MGEKSLGTLALPLAGAWRAPVLNACLWIAAILGLVWLILVAVAYPAVRGSIELGIVSACLVAAWVGAVGRRLRESVRVFLLQCWCFGVAGVALEIGGPRPAAVVMMVLFVLLTTLYRGPRAGLLATGLVLATYVVVGAGWVAGVLPHTAGLSEVDFENPRPWITGVAVQLFGVGAVATIVAYVLAHANRALQAAQESEEKFAKAFRASPDAIVISDAQTGRIIDLNGSFERVFGYRRDESVGRTTLELGFWIDPKDREAFIAAIRRDGSLRNYSGTVRRSDGSTITCETSVEVVNLGGRRCLLGIVHDITERLRQEGIRAQLETQLRERQKLEALGALAGGVAHDFNNLLMGILANAEMAAVDAADPAEVRAHVGQILTAGGRARDLVHQILAFSRRQPGERRPTRFDRVLTEAMKLLRSSLPATIEIKTQIDSTCPPILADASQLHQVVMNLGTNAAHAMRERVGVLAVHLDSTEVAPALAALMPELKPGKYARLTVADSGCGMSEATRARIFEPFYTTKAPGEGTGLGLAVVHGIVRAHDGAITVNSAEGAGSTFTLYFPALASPAIESFDPGAAEPAGQGETILLIDDEAVVCRAIAKSLEHEGYRVASYTDANDALNRLHQTPRAFAVLLTDLTMPRITGVDVARAAHAVQPDLPVLLMSGFSGSWTREKVQALGIRDLLFKPISREDLTGAIRSAIDARVKS